MIRYAVLPVLVAVALAFAAVEPAEAAPLSSVGQLPGPTAFGWGIGFGVSYPVGHYHSRPAYVYPQPVYQTIPVYQTVVVGYDAYGYPITQTVVTGYRTVAVGGPAMAVPVYRPRPRVSVGFGYYGR